jgi:hypothetical protein
VCGLPGCREDSESLPSNIPSQHHPSTPSRLILIEQFKPSNCCCQTPGICLCSPRLTRCVRKATYAVYSTHPILRHAWKINRRVKRKASQTNADQCNIILCSFWLLKSTPEELGQRHFLLAKSIASLDVRLNTRYLWRRRPMPMMLSLLCSRFRRYVLGRRGLMQPAIIIWHTIVQLLSQ